MPKAPRIQPTRSRLVPVPRSPQTEVCCPCRWCRTSWWWSHPWLASADTHTAQPPLASQQRRLLETPGQCRMLARKLAAAQSQREPNDGDIVVCDSVGQVCSFSFTWQDRKVWQGLFGAYKDRVLSCGFPIDFIQNFLIFKVYDGSTKSV